MTRAAEEGDRFVAGSLLSYLAPEDRVYLQTQGTVRVLPAHTAVMHEGDPTRHVLILLSGWVRVYSSSEDGQVVLFALRGPGDVIGDLAALQNWTRTATVETMQPIRFLQLLTDDFVSCLEGRPSVALGLLRQMSVRLRDAEKARMDFVTLDVARRVALVLLRLAEDYGRLQPEGIVVRTPLTQQDIADRIGASRRAVSRAMTTLRERGIVTTGRQMFVVAAPDVLRLFAGCAPDGT